MIINHIFFNRMHLASNIKYLRGLKDWTQTELAEALNLDPSTITIWERGKSAPQLSTLIKLRDIFGVDLESMVFTDLRTATPRTVQEKTGSYHAESEKDSRLLNLIQQVEALRAEVAMLLPLRERTTALEEQVKMLAQENDLLLKSLQSLKGGGE